jgi:hypothetical protein
MSARFVIAVTSAADRAVETPLRQYSETREPCRRYDPLRIPFFGDLHVHTAYSQDASTQGTRTTPRDAYRFARGETIGIQPFDSSGRASRALRLKRPIDFAAVTDHAEQLGETRVCQTPGLPGYNSALCRSYRWWPRLAFFWMNLRTAGTDTPERFGFCGDDGRRCLESTQTVWTEITDAAELAYDRTSMCEFTTFVGYEWTGAPGGNNLHRNVIFRNEKRTPLPVSYIEAPAPEILWRMLREQCMDIANGCEALIIPHNSNLSGGMMFNTVARDGKPFDRAYAAERAAREPLVEVMQHKGDSECIRSPMSEDEYCDFEKLPYASFREKYVPTLRRSAEPKAFVREALKQGLALDASLGVNPFKVGMVASTDTHLGASGAVEEDEFLGHGGAGVPARDRIPPGLPDDLEFNPGGLAVVWAEENSRDSLFQAMKRREVYGTSGPRFVVRLFGGFDYPPGICGSDDFVRLGYELGVPMGGEFRVSSGRAPLAPTLAVWALADVGTNEQAAVPLDRVQIVKGWLDTKGRLHEKVYDVAVGEPYAGAEPASVDPKTCELSGAGPKSLCSLWTDPDFDAAERAFYYARVLETPTCRWSQRLCNAGGVNCKDRRTIGPGFEGCCDKKHRPLIQERAWTSPIWFSPSAGGAE